jgi:biopolymer transport protein ExbB/TolQ
MSLRVFEQGYAEERAPLLRWLIFTGVCAFGFALLWRYGLFKLMLASDKTNISLIITLLYVATSIHCLWRTNTISKELDVARKVEAIVSAGTNKFTVAAKTVLADAGERLPPGAVTNHIRNLVLKSGLQGRHRLDQTLLLRGLADQLRGPNTLGSFASDSLMKLGLLGTIIGFIMMLAPIAGLDAANQGALKSSMNLMSDGMAVAMYTTLSGLVGSILVKIQYHMLDGATARLFVFATDLTEVFVVSVLERENG